MQQESLSRALDETGRTHIASECYPDNLTDPKKVIATYTFEYVYSPQLGTASIVAWCGLAVNIVSSGYNASLKGDVIMSNQNRTCTFTIQFTLNDNVLEERTISCYVPNSGDVVTTVS